ncbi:hypothetical protein C1645_757154 [Glomus cerebriforme]|uniref:Uncharacterized protein n=1 Tax=Glomus cerebriforme TaxID=658196 RepID=A0A397TKL3_9GLOM|nr:hypothetical protein C1645_757154 [Glomus cerebriforme]
MEPEINLTLPRKREHPAELDLDQLGTERAKRRYVSEFLSSELTALSLRGNESLSNNIVVQPENCIMDIEDNQAVSPTRRKHVVMVTNLESETDSEHSEEENTSFEIPREIRKSLKKIPKELLVPRTENPVRALVLYQRPPWLPQESFTQGNKPRKNKEMMHERRIIDIMENGKLSPIPEDPTSPAIEMDLDFGTNLEGEIHKNYEGYLGDDDEMMEL